MLLILSTNVHGVTASGGRMRHKMERKKEQDLAAAADAARPSTPAQVREHEDDTTNINRHRKNEEDWKRKLNSDAESSVVASVESKFMRLQSGATQYGQGSRSEPVRTKEQGNGKVAGQEVRPKKVSAASINHAIENNLEQRRHKTREEKVSTNALTSNKDTKKARSHEKQLRFNPTDFPTPRPTTFVPTALPTFRDKWGQAYQGPLPEYVYVEASGRKSNWSGGKGRGNGYLVPYVAPPTYMPTTFMPTTYPPTVDPDATPSPNILPTYRPTYNPTTSYPTFSPVWDGGWWGWHGWSWSGGQGGPAEPGWLPSEPGRSGKSRWSVESKNGKAGRPVEYAGSSKGNKLDRPGLPRQGRSSKGGKEGRFGGPIGSSKSGKEIGPNWSSKGGKSKEEYGLVEGSKPGGNRESGKGGKSVGVGAMEWQDWTWQTSGQEYPENMGWWGGTSHAGVSTRNGHLTDAVTASTKDYNKGSSKGGKGRRHLNQASHAEERNSEFVSDAVH